MTSFWVVITIAWWAAVTLVPAISSWNNDQRRGALAFLVAGVLGFMLIGWLATQHGREAEDDSEPGAPFGEWREYTKYPLATKESDSARGWSQQESLAAR